LGVYAIRSQADALVRRLLCLLSKEMQHQMGKARTIQRNDAKQLSVSGAFCLWKGHNKLETKMMSSSAPSRENLAKSKSIRY
jgi:hypothetical protein